MKYNNKASSVRTLFADMAELADARDLESRGSYLASSNLVVSTTPPRAFFGAVRRSRRPPVCIRYNIYGDVAHPVERYVRNV